MEEFKRGSEEEKPVEESAEDFGAYLRQLREQEEDALDLDEEDEKPRFSRFRDIFSWLFGRDINRDKHEADDPKKIEQPAELAYEAPKELPPNEAPEEIVEQSMAEENVPGPEKIETAPPELEPAAPNTVALEATVPHQARAQEVSLDEVRYEARAAARNQAVGTSLLTGLVVDQLSRRRDRKIRAEQKEQAKEIKKVEQRQEKLQTAQEASRAQLKSLLTIEEAGKLIESQQPGLQNAEQLQQLDPRPKDNAELQPVAQKEQVKYAMPDLENIEQPLYKPVAEVKPETVLKRVEKAAEKGVPLENIFERRHEVKDAPTPDTMKSVGDILKKGTPSVPASRASYGQNWEQQLRAAQQQAAFSPHQSDKTIYKKAVGRGLAAAAVILAIALILAIL